MMRLTRQFAASRSVLEHYAAVLLQNKAVWEQIVPRSTASSQLGFFAPDAIDHAGLDHSLSIIWDLLDRKGKMLRSALVLLVADAYQVARSRALPIAFMVESVHNATLMIDDIEDRSQFRRGEPCSHLKFGVDNTINAGCLGYFLPVDRALSCPELAQLPAEAQLALHRTYLQEMKALHLGMAWDIYWHNQAFTPATLPTEADYLKMVQSKTSVLMRIGLKMIAIAGQLPAAELEKLERLANHLGTSFQIQDDIINLESTDYSKGRGGISGEDITEGKITLLVVRHVATTKDQWLLDLLGLKTEDPRLIEQARRAMHESGAIAYCHQVKQAHMQQAVDLLESLAVPADWKESLRAVLSELLHRSK